ncbi:NAD(P)/FAD-dependent oxidoreductase [Nonomuraea sp. NPDC050022]|uniref:NAD(P)/FAD-dependent oxidoreductase n=1 Tax=unclassified Nonomuraea TaxID=2593643 RepID=UPI0033C7E550
MKLTSYWLDTAEPAGDFRRTELPANVDVAVIGAGLTGLSAALHLARGGASVAVLESHTVGWGASGRNGGMATTGLAISLPAAVKRYGPERAAMMFTAYDNAIDTVEKIVTEERIDCHFERSGKLTLAAKPAHYAALERSARVIEKLVGRTVQLVPRGRMRDELGSDRYYGAQVDPNGAGAHVGKLVMGLARAAVGHGALIAENAAVTGVRRGGRGHQVQTTRGALTASDVLIATSGYTGKLTPWLRRRIVPVGSFIVVTEPLPDDLVAQLMPHRRMASDTKNLLYYFRPTPDNRLLFGGRARFALSDAQSDLKSGEILRKAVTEVFPQLRDVRLDYCWGGLVDMTMDQMVHAGVRDGMHYSVGYSGHGVQMATHMGKVMAEVIGGDSTANPWQGLAFPPVPGHFGPPWFLPAAGAFYRALDAVR